MPRAAPRDTSARASLPQKRRHLKRDVLRSLWEWQAFTSPQAIQIPNKQFSPAKRHRTHHQQSPHQYAFPYYPSLPRHPTNRTQKTRTLQRDCRTFQASLSRTNAPSLTSYPHRPIFYPNTPPHQLFFSIHTKKAKHLTNFRTCPPS